MSKHNEVKATQHKHDLADKRELQRKRSRLVAILGCMVVLVTALALMVPAISFTQEAAEEVGIVMDKPADATDEATEPASETVEAEESAAVEEPGAAEEPAVEEAVSNDDAQSVEEEAAADESATDAVASDAEDAADDEATTDDAEDAQEAEVSTAAIEDATASSVGAIDPDSEDEEMPAQSFSADLKDANGNSVLTVAVEAPEGAFPAGAFMKIDGIAANKVQDKVEEAIKDANNTDEVTITNLTAVDIIFRDTDGNEIEPAKKVEVKITTNDVRNFDNPALVHVLDKTKKSSKGKSDDAEIVKNVSIVNQDDNDNSVGAENTMKFESKAFSPYVIVEYSLEAAGAAADNVAADADAPAQTLQGEAGSVKVTATVPEGALPEGATMDVSAVDAAKIQDAVTQAVEKAEADTAVTQIAAVDITFANAEGEEVQPELPVKVTMTDTAAPESGSSVVARVDGQGNADVVEQSVVTNVANKAIFDADSSSVYALVGTETISATYLTDDGKTVKVTLAFGENVHLPDDAALEVTEIGLKDSEWNTRSVQLAAALFDKYGNVTISDARFLSLRITVGGEEFKVDAPAEIRVEYIDTMNTEDTAEYRYDDDAGKEFRPDPEEQITHLAAFSYSGNEAEFHNAESEESDAGIAESTFVSKDFAEIDLAYVYEYTAPSAD